MASHGIPRLSGSKPSSDLARRKELRKIEEYKTLVEQVKLGISKPFSTDLFRKLSNVLEINPEYYTMWNHRRLVIRDLFFQAAKGESSESSDKDGAINARSIADLISDELEFLLPLLRQFPKCYWIWNYRLWVLQEARRVLPKHEARSLWQNELGLSSKMLSLDNRNFMGWGYRRTVVCELESERLSSKGEQKSKTEDEFAYTTKMIESNLSNFSAWHNRSKLIPRLLDERKADDNARLDFLDSELELIQRALSDPSDQSLWFYYQYLICTFDPVYAHRSMAPNMTTEQRLAYVKRQLESVIEMLEFDEDCKWIYKGLIQLNVLHKTLSQKWLSQKSQIISWTHRLRELDPLRKGRWEDLERTLDL